MSVKVIENEAKLLKIDIICNICNDIISLKSEKLVIKGDEYEFHQLNGKGESSVTYCGSISCPYDLEMQLVINEK